MDFIGLLLDFVLHVDVHLRLFVENHGAWVYALLFAVIFVETGVVVMPFLPGDSLLFMVGALAGVGLLDAKLAMLVMITAAIAGNQSNYAIGRWVGPRVFQWEQSRWFNRGAFDRTHAFYERYGGVTLIAARFLPFLRTFAPFVAGVAAMTRSRFTFFDVAGALLWVLSITTAGLLFGQMPWVQENLDKIIWAMILIPGVLALLGGLRARLRKQAEPL